MHKTSRLFLVAVTCATLVLVPAAPATAAGPGPSLASLGDGGALPNSSSYGSSGVTPDGRHVAFNSSATNLVPGLVSQIGQNQVYVRDRTTNATVAVSVNSSGAFANESSYYPIISASGRHATFWSNAGNLGDGNTNFSYHCYVRDLQLNTTVRAAGTFDNTSNCFGISPDGNVVGFSGELRTGWPGYFCPQFPCNWTGYNAYVRNRTTGVISPVAIDSTGNHGAVNSGVWSSYQAYRPSMSDDGTIVAFWSSSPLVPGVEPGFHIYVRNMVTGTVQLIASPHGVQGTQNNHASVSGDGRYVVYTSLRPDRLAYHVFRRDLQTGAETLVNVASPDVPMSGSVNEPPAVSTDGRYVGFVNAPVIDTSGMGTNSHVFVRDMQTGVITQADVTPAGQQPNDASFGPLQLTQDGLVVFGSFATDLTTAPVPRPQAYLSAPAVPASPAGLSASSPAITAQLTWDSVGSATSYNIYRDGLLAGTSISAAYSDNTASEGTHTYYVTAVAIGGESAASNSVTVTTDRTAPVVGTFTWSTNPKPLAATASLSVGATDDLSGVAVAEYYLGDLDPGPGNGVAMSPDGAGFAASFGNALASGVHKVNVRARDGAGNWSPVTFDFLTVYDPSGPTDVAGKKTLTPVHTDVDNNPVDLLPGLTGNAQSDDVNFGFDVMYRPDGTVDQASTFSFTYFVGYAGNKNKNCKLPNPSDCHSTQFTATSVDWLSVSGANSSVGSFQGVGTLVVDGTTTNNPFRVTAIDGGRLSPVQGDSVSLHVYAPGANPATATALYRVTGRPAGSGVIIQ
ncbi:hypothetical protein PV646_37730 [Streptomyces sp. ID05-26A]|nr:hypothetical protein [Streptomyces sp. ID05-26A]